MIDWGPDIAIDLARAERREWLVTNGLGGYASGTIAGLPTRSYHGLLIAAPAAPRGRTLLVSALDERVVYDGRVWPLATWRWTSGIVSPCGYRRVVRFTLDAGTPVWTYACADALVEKRVFMTHGRNTTWIVYRVERASGPVALELKVLASCRDHHAVTRAGDRRMAVEALPDGVRVAPLTDAAAFTVRAQDVECDPQHEWYRDVDLARERERGLPATDDVLHVATLRRTLVSGESLGVVASADGDTDVDGTAAWRRTEGRCAAILARWRSAAPVAATAPRWIEQLVLAADQFLIEGPDGTAGVIAGYHWFDEWGRDTMISVPGLTLATGRDDLARAVVARFAPFVRDGLLPNWLPAGAASADGAAYNTVDAALWYVEALRAVHAATIDDELLDGCMPVVTEILERYRDGTRHGIAMDPSDALVAAGEAGVQLTWMDAKVDGHVVTPRIGKAVEVNALWYNALVAMAGFAARLGRPVAAWETLAARAKMGFDRFWNEDTGHCWDVLDGPDGHDASLRPNQILAVSLAESPLALDRQRRVVDVCARRLLTPFGLRSLAPDDRAYRGRYEGTRVERDEAYHQGTVWAWLLGPFALAHLRVHGDPVLAASYLAPMASALEVAGVGTIAEIFDGDAPFTPRGAIAQAWSVAETLRAWHAIAAASAR